MTERLKSSVTTETAECLRCEWRSAGGGTIGRAAQHHDNHGHPVQVHVQRTTTYGDPNAPLEGQEPLELEGAGYQEGAIETTGTQEPPR